MQVFRSQDMQRQASVLQETAMKEPVIITYHDRPRLVLMSMEEYDRLRGRNRSRPSKVELPEEILEQIGTLANDRPEAAE